MDDPLVICKPIFLTNSFIVENFGISTIRIPPPKLPHIKKIFPINKWQKILQILVSNNFGAKKSRFDWLVSFPVGLQTLGPFIYCTQALFYQ